MYRGTTPTLTFDMPFSEGGLEKLYITFCQNGTQILEKTLDDVTYDAQTITLALSQADTLAFSSGIVDIQMRAKFSDGSAIASDIIRTNANKILKEGEI